MSLLRKFVWPMEGQPISYDCLRRYALLWDFIPITLYGEEEDVDDSHVEPGKLPQEKPKDHSEINLAA